MVCCSGAVQTGCGRTLNPILLDPPKDTHSFHNPWEFPCVTRFPCNTCSAPQCQGTGIRTKTLYASLKWAVVCTRSHPVLNCLPRRGQVPRACLIDPLWAIHVAEACLRLCLLFVCFTCIARARITRFRCIPGALSRKMGNIGKVGGNGGKWANFFVFRGKTGETCTRKLQKRPFLAGHWGRGG